MTDEEYGFLFHEAKVNLVAFKPIYLCSDELRKMVEMAIEKEREAIWNIILEYAGRDDLTSEDESLLKHLADLIKARGQA